MWILREMVETSRNFAGAKKEDERGGDGQTDRRAREKAAAAASSHVVWRGEEIRGM